MILTSKETIDLCSRAFIAWNFATFDGKDMEMSQEYNHSSFIAQVLRKKMEVFKIPVQLPDYLLAIIELCTQSNPGVSQVMLKEILAAIPNLQPGHKVTPEDFNRVYTADFPTMENPRWEKHFEKLWDAQKNSEGENLCDTVDWWMELFK